MHQHQQSQQLYLIKLHHHLLQLQLQQQHPVHHDQQPVMIIMVEYVLLIWVNLIDIMMVIASHVVRLIHYPRSVVIIMIVMIPYISVMLLWMVYIMWIMMVTVPIAIIRLV
jgi:hypothetical protein